MRLIFAGTPDFSVPALNALAERHEIVAVFTQPDRRAGRGKKWLPPPVKSAAIELGLDAHQPDSLADQQSLIATLKADAMIVVAYGLLLPQAILDTPRLGCLNIHASLLPRWRGAAPIQRAIEAGDTETGICIMQMQAGLDTGPVLRRVTRAITPVDTSASLHESLAELGANAVVDTLEALSANPELTAQEQDNERASYAKKITKAEANINWADTATQIERRIRAFNPWPICQSHHSSQRLRVWEAQVLDNSSELPAGTVADVSSEGIDIACAKQTLRLLRLQRDGSKPLAIRDFLNGYSIEIGDQLGESLD